MDSHLQQQQSQNFINNMFMGHQREIAEERDLVNERRYDLCNRLSISTGISLARGGCPVVKIVQNSKRECSIQLASYEWERFWEINECKADGHLIQRKKCIDNAPTHSAQVVVGPQEVEQEEEKERLDEKLSVFINIFFGCKKNGLTRYIKYMRIESRGKEVMLHATSYKKMKQLRELITMRLQRLVLMNFPIYYDEVIKYIHANKMDNESMLACIERLPAINHGWTALEELEYHQCMFEIVTLIPEQIKIAIGALKAQPIE